MTVFTVFVSLLPRLLISHSDLFDRKENGGFSACEVWELAADLLKMKELWSDALNESDFDAVIFPCLPIPAVAHGKCGKIMSVSYMFIANLLGWPSGCVPITTIREEEQHYCKQYLPADQRDMMATAVAREMVGSAGLPIGISVMTANYEDEKCLRVMKDIEKGVQFKAKATAFQRKKMR